MVIIKDYKTPDGRQIERDLSVNKSGPCVTRPMTEKERDEYGVEKWRKENLNEDGTRKNPPHFDQYSDFTW